MWNLILYFVFLEKKMSTKYESGNNKSGSFYTILLIMLYIFSYVAFGKVLNIELSL